MKFRFQHSCGIQKIRRVHFPFCHDNLFLYGEVKNIVKELNINFIDINEDVISISKQPLSFFPFGMSGHYSVYGYKTISEFIAKNIN